MFSDQNRMKLEISNRKKCRNVKTHAKTTHELKKKSKGNHKYFEMNTNEYNVSKHEMKLKKGLE